MSTELQSDLKRFLFIVPYVAQRKDGVPIDELCERLEMSRSSLVGLLTRAIAIGPPDGTPDEMVEIYLDADRVHVALPQRFTQLPRFSLEEALSLLVVLSPLRSAPLPELAREAEELSQMLLALTSERVTESATDLGNRLVVESEGTESPGDLATLEAAVASHQVIRMEYYTASRDVMTTRELRPLGLIQNRGAWYVLGNDGRTFKVERIRRLELTDERFQPPKGFDLEAYRDRYFLPSDCDPGSATFRRDGEDFSFPASVRYSVQHVLSHRGEIELREPSEARAALIEEARALLRLY